VNSEESHGPHSVSGSDGTYTGANWAGRTLSGADGIEIGVIDNLYSDPNSGEPTFATVHTGMFGTETRVVPLANAEVQGDSVVVPYDQELVSDAPNIDTDAGLSPDEEQRLFSHYGIDGGTSTP
jgi:hypothetical protein